MAERRGGQPGPGQPGPEHSRPGLDRTPANARVIRGAELDQLKASRPWMANSRFALEWQDERGSKHLSYNHRRSTVDQDGNERVLFYHDTPPTFDSTYGDWHTGTAYQAGPHGDVPLGELYTLYLRKSELGRSALDRFLTEADEAGYDVARWFSGRRDGAGLRAVSQDGASVQAMTFLLRVAVKKR